MQESGTPVAATLTISALLAVACAASPLSNNNSVYAFVHKSLQEYNVAHAIVATVLGSVHVSGLTPADLVEFARVWMQEGARADTRQGDAHTDTLEASRVLRKCGFNKGTGEDGEPDGATVRRQARGMARLRDQLAASGLQRLELGEEEAVRDFLVDMLLQDLRFALSLEALVRVEVAQLQGVLEAKVHKQETQLLDLGNYTETLHEKLLDLLNYTETLGNYTEKLRQDLEKLSQCTGCVPPSPPPPSPPSLPPPPMPPVHL